MLEKIVVPLDESVLSGAVLRVALSIADRFDAQVWLLRIQNGRAPLEPDETEAALDKVEAIGDQMLYEALASLREGHTLSADKVHAEVRGGPVVDAILGAVQDHFADLVVMGTHGREGVTEMVTGSTAEQVVSRTPVSVLVVKPEGFPYLRDP